jgi:hypothetical protein
MQQTHTFMKACFRAGNLMTYNVEPEDSECIMIWLVKLLQIVQHLQRKQAPVFS